MVVAAVDAFRQEDEPAPPSATTAIENRDELAAALTELGARGELLLFGDGCSVSVLELPSLVLDPKEDCSPRGSRSPDGELVAACRGNETEIFYTADGSVYGGSPGCAPAWRPDGVLTVAYRREVVRFRLPCRRTTFCPVTLIPRAELERAARRHPTVPDPPIHVRALVEDVAWLSNERAAVSLSIELGARYDRVGPLNALAFFRRGRLDATPPYYRETGGDLAASPRGTYVTETPDVILRADGSGVTLPPHLQDARDFAWSPDERFLAMATRFAIVVIAVESLERYDRTGGGLRSVTVPETALQLEWR